MNDPLDLSGVWYGRYGSRVDDQENSFIALIEEGGGVFTGSITEPDDEGGGIRRATIAGRRTGQALFFVKQYTGRWTHAVRYAGRIDDAGKVIDGSWSVDWLTGGFDMEREKFDAGALEAEEEAEIPMSADVH
ncbi:hypothetical protein [Sphingomonas soli]|uniref:hypothetical protein n=1 Tax=Sphingomonas soli TaxID=266127 RepID=UPI0008348159|nr:hypothetical protein [Sphingomonas soli]